MIESSEASEASEASTPSPTTSARASKGAADGRRAALIRGGLMILGGAVVLLGLVLVAEANLDAATVGLGFAAVMLLYAISRLYAVVAVLAAPASADQARSLGRTRAELRDEKRRLLRAIKELEFDHGMGKLSRADFDAVSATYKARAIEVMRALDGASDLHPELEALLRRRAAGEGSAAASETLTSEAATTTPAASAAKSTSRRCSACAADNDDDARFCKRCGTELAA